MTDRKQMKASIYIKTTKKDAIIWSEKIDGRSGDLKVIVLFSARSSLIMIETKKPSRQQHQNRSKYSITSLFKGA